MPDLSPVTSSKTASTYCTYTYKYPHIYVCVYKKIIIVQASSLAHELITSSKTVCTLAIQREVQEMYAVEIRRARQTTFTTAVVAGCECCFVC